MKPPKTIFRIVTLCTGYKKMDTMQSESVSTLSEALKQIAMCSCSSEKQNQLTVIKLINK